MNEESQTSALMPHVRLGVRGLPNLSNGLNPGGLYVLVAETATARFPLLASCLATALHDGRRCSVILPGNPEGFLRRVETLAGLSMQDYFTSGQCACFTTQEELQRRMFRFGAERFTRELEQFDVPDDSLLVFDQADDLLALHDIGMAVEQIDVISRWLAQHRVTALMVFLRLTDAQSANLNALMDSLSGLARLGGDADGLRLNFDYWQSPDGAVAARHYPLDTLPNGLYEATQRSGATAGTTKTGTGASAPADAQGMAPAPDEIQHHYYMDADLGGLSKVMPGPWHYVDTLVGMMHATRNQKAPTVIFCYRSDTTVRQLAEAVHTLRVNLGPHAHLVVQEKGASLRYQNEALLLRLGVNLVIHRDVQPERIPLLLSSLSGQMFNRDVNIDFEAALASVTPTRMRGYHPPMAFVREVRNLLDRSAPLNIPFVLVSGLPLQGQSMLDVLSLMRLSRAGDLVTADTRQCHIYLHACQQAVALAALERILGTPVDQVFEEIRFHVQRAEIDVELEALLQNASAGKALDYTAQLPEQDAPPPSAVAAPAAAQPPSTAAPGLATPLAGFSRAAPGSPTPQAHAASAPLRGVDVPEPPAVAPPPVPGAAGDTPYRQARATPATYGRESAPRARRRGAPLQ